MNHVANATVLIPAYLVMGAGIGYALAMFVVVPFTQQTGWLFYGAVGGAIFGLISAAWGLVRALWWALDPSMSILPVKHS